MIKVQYIGIVLIALIIGVSQVHAQDDMAKVLAQIKSANNLTTMRYDYKLQIVNSRTGAIAEQFSGSGYKQGGSYLDSNDAGITLVNGDYYFKLDKGRKLATIAKISVLKSRMGISLKNSSDPVALIPDSTLIKEGKLSQERKPNGEHWVHITFPAYENTGIHFQVDQKTMRVSLMRLEVADNAYGKDYKKVYTVYNIKVKFDKNILDPKRYFNARGTHIELNKAYAGYKLDTITN